MRNLFIILFATMLSIQLVAQERTLTGTIVNTEGMPLQGVSITIKNYHLHTTISNFEGKFKIKVPDYAEVLIFSMKEMEKQEKIIGDQNVFNIIMSAKPFSQNKFSISAGVNYSKIRHQFSHSLTDNLSTRRLGFTLGIELEHRLNATTFIKSGLLYSAKGAGGDLDESLFYSTEETYQNLHLYYIDLPIYIGRYWGNTFIFTGSTLSFGIWGKVEYGTNPTSQRIPINTNFTSILPDVLSIYQDLKRFDLGLALGAGHRFGSFTIYSKYSLGITNFVRLDSSYDSTPENSLRNNVISISASYSF